MDRTWLTTRADLIHEMAQTYTEFVKEDWDRLLEKMLPGDELWRFAPPSKHDIQIGGVAILRGDVIVSKVVYWIA